MSADLKRAAIAAGMPFSEAKHFTDAELQEFLDHPLRATVIFKNLRRRHEEASDDDIEQALAACGGHAGKAHSLLNEAKQKGITDADHPLRATVPFKNLRRRYEEASDDDIEQALAACGGHAGEASSLLDEAKQKGITVAEVLDLRGQQQARQAEAAKQKALRCPLLAQLSVTVGKFPDGGEGVLVTHSGGAVYKLSSCFGYDSEIYQSASLDEEQGSVVLFWKREDRVSHDGDTKTVKGKTALSFDEGANVLKGAPL